MESADLSEDERSMRLETVEQIQFKLKRRMLGNMRFVGELYKEGLLKSGPMLECINSVMEQKPLKDENIELLCKLLHTVGSELDSKVNAKQSRDLEEKFVKIAELSQDKSLSARMRFSLEEVLALRQNKWQARREQEGPATIEEIHHKIAQEEMLKRSHSGLPSTMVGGLSSATSSPLIGGTGAGGVGTSMRQRPPTTTAIDGSSRVPYGTASATSSSSVEFRNSGGYGNSNMDSSRYGPNTTGRGYGARMDSNTNLQRTVSLGPGVSAGSRGGDRGGGGGGASSGMYDNNNFRRLPSDSQSAYGGVSSAAQQQQHRRGASSISSGPGVGIGYSNTNNYPTNMNAKYSISTQLRKQYQSLMNELLETADVKDILSTLGDAMQPNEVYNLILVIISKYIDISSKPKIREQQDILTTFLGKFLSKTRHLNDCIEFAILQCEEVQNIMETQLDYKQAPEHLGHLITNIVQCGACRKEFVESQLFIRKQDCLKDEIYSGLEVEEIYSRLFVAIR